jgi:tRNA pseudouridine38-40 synthase
MTDRAIQLVMHYDGSEFAGWQRQPNARTVQGVLEEAITKLTGTPATATGAGRTDAGVHARGQAAGLVLPERWTAAEIRRALNAVLPADVWIAAAYEMDPVFHARHSAVARSYSYRIGTSEACLSPFRRRWEHAILRPLDHEALAQAAAATVGTHHFLAFAVRGTAPATDSHACHVQTAEWQLLDDGLVFVIEANRFLHHMVRFLVGTMLDIGLGRRPVSDMKELLTAGSNDDASPPAPAHALCLERVKYPETLYRAAA